ncbi:uncharacterized protein LOC119369557 isoform X2 [Jatropha curcas]|nr:uncharacterized protein LOC119369557 isoform X2 [Jatropha curcas]
MIQRLFLTILIDNLLLHLGEDNVDLLLEILTECSGLQKSNSQSSDSLDSLFDDKDASNPPEYSTFVEPKEVTSWDLIMFMPNHLFSSSNLKIYDEYLRLNPQDLSKCMEVLPVCSIIIDQVF